jgi:hypothetical protein
MRKNFAPDRHDGDLRRSFPVVSLGLRVDAHRKRRAVRSFLLKGLNEAKEQKTLNRKGNPPRRMPDPVPGATSGKISLDKFRNAASVE